jgi:nucleoid-associated protein YgaU
MSHVARKVEEIEDPAPIYEWEHDGYPLHVLWGRVFVLAALLLIAFLIGRTRPAASVPPEQVESLRSELASAEERIAALERQIEERSTPAEEKAVPTDTEADTGAGAGAPDVGARERPADADAAASEVYVVESGDSLNLIADRVYGDASLADLIARANNIDRAGQIKVGDKLEIPAEP